MAEAGKPLLAEVISGRLDNALVPADPGESDLSASPTWPGLGITYEQFVSGDPIDLSGLSLAYEP